MARPGGFGGEDAAGHAGPAVVGGVIPAVVETHGTSVHGDFSLGEEIVIFGGDAGGSFQ